ncbi:MAG: hypothetical protein ACR2RA_21270 [Geminicoccaceae bacterium]
MRARYGRLLAMAIMSTETFAMDDERFQRRMNIAAADLAMLNMGGRMLADRIKTCRAEHPDWDEAELDAYKTRVSTDLRARMESFLQKVLEDDDAGIDDIRALQREHRDQLERKILREVLARAVHSCAYVLDQVDWTCQTS